MSEEFKPLPAIPEEAWRYHEELQRIQNEVTGAALGFKPITQKPGDRTAAPYTRTWGTHGDASTSDKGSRNDRG